ncbi:hypothetical protein ABGB14_22145 [Nonomuraea sp. B10E15]
MFAIDLKPEAGRTPKRPMEGGVGSRARTGGALTCHLLPARASAP